MTVRLLISAVFSSILILSTNPAFAADQQTIYGSQLMTEQEREEHRNRMRNATSAEEREQIRKEHHKRMLERARAKGIDLPEEPPAIRGGKGMGMGKGMGGGKNQGSGMGMGRN